MGDIRAFPTHDVVYISGPMTATGQPDFNYPAFNAEAERLRALGWYVLNPAENHDGETGLEHHVYMRTDIPEVTRCDFICLLPGWENSVGATVELIVAVACKIPVFYAGQLPSDAKFVDAKEFLFGNKNGVAVGRETVSPSVVYSSYKCSNAGVPCGCGSWLVDDAPLEQPEEETVTGSLTPVAAIQTEFPRLQTLQSLHKE